MITWRRYEEVFSGADHAITGEAWVGENVASAALALPRRVVVRLPSVARPERQPVAVLYLMDGQNMFADGRAHRGGWRVDRRLDALADDGLDLMVVAVDASADRDTEYVPYDWPGGARSRADDFADLVASVVVPAVEARFPIADRGQRFVGGSSFGATASLYALMQRPDTFAGAMLMSPSVWPADRALLRDLRRGDTVSGRIWIDVGTRELSGPRSMWTLHSASRRYARDAEKLHQVLVRDRADGGAGVAFRKARSARHHDSDWSERFGAAVKFLLDG